MRFLGGSFTFPGFMGGTEISGPSPVFVTGSSFGGSGFTIGGFSCDAGGGAELSGEFWPFNHMTGSETAQYRATQRSQENGR